MPDNADNQARESKPLLVERMPKMRMRIKPELLPELAAYILLVGKRYERLRESALKLPHSRDCKYTTNTARVMEQWLSCLQHLMDKLSDTFSLHEWNAALIEIDTAFNTKIGPLSFEHYDGHNAGDNLPEG